MGTRLKDEKFASVRDRFSFFLYWTRKSAVQRIEKRVERKLDQVNGGQRGKRYFKAMIEVCVTLGTQLKNFNNMLKHLYAITLGSI